MNSTSGAGAVRRALGGVEIGGAVYGILIVARYLDAANTKTVPSMWIFFATIFFLCYGIAGWQLLKGSRLGISVSLLLQLPQLLWVNTASFTFAIYSGVALYVRVSGDHLSLINFQVGSGVELAGNHPVIAGTYAINVVPILIASALLILMQAVPDQESEARAE